MTVTPVANSELSQRLDERYAAKYDMAEVFGDDLPAWRYYRAVPAEFDPGGDHATE